MHMQGARPTVAHTSLKDIIFDDLRAQGVRVPHAPEALTPKALEAALVELLSQPR